jgi:hypothetical protein
MLCEEEKMHATAKQYTNDHKTKHTQYIVFPEIPNDCSACQNFSVIYGTQGSPQGS